jgi:uncharacterized protein
MRTSRSRTGAASLAMIAVATTLSLTVAMCAVVEPSFARDKFPSSQVAMERGLSAYRAGYFPLALEAFEFARDREPVSARYAAEFYLARIYSDNSSVHTDHAKAYMLLQRIVEENFDADPDDLPRGPIVAKALTALATYVKRGLPAAHVKADAERAAEFLRMAATTFDEPDAQFELAKMLIIGDGVPQDQTLALHYLSKLAQDSHPGAQAFLADLHWQGKFVPKDQNRALGLIEMAAENAPPSERLWIDELYQNIFCGAPPDVRSKAQGLVANWRRTFARPKGDDVPMGLGGRDMAPPRSCRNGEPLRLRQGRGTDAGAANSEAFKTVSPSALDAVNPGLTSGYRPTGSVK